MSLSVTQENRLRGMRVLAVRLGSYSYTGGIERACRDSDQVLIEAGVDLVVISLWDRSGDIPSGWAGQRYYGCGRNKWLFLWRFLGNILALRWDVVWIQHRVLTPLIGVVRLLTRAKIMVWVFGWEVWSPPARSASVWMRMADRVISISAHTALKCSSLYGISKGRMRICPLGVSQSMDGGDGTVLEGIPHDPFVLVVSRLVLPDAEQKGVLRVCDAMVKVIKEVPAASCVVVGEGLARQAFQEKVKALGLADRIVFTGRLSDAELHWLYRKAAVFALPSTVEGFGLVYVEAMVNRVPVVAGNLDAAADVVVDGSTGFLVDPLDIDAITKALVTLLKNDVLRVRMGYNGYDRSQQEFTYESMRQRLLAIFVESES